MRRLLVVGLLLAYLPLARAGLPEPGYSDTSAVSGLSSPTAVAFMPDGRMLVTEKGGALRLVDGGVPTTLVTIPVCNTSEMGLLGIALDPSFDTNGGFIYLYRTKQGSSPPCGGTGRVNEVVRVTMASDDTVSIGSLIVLLTGMRTDNGNHDGGVLRIGPDDKLYVGVGDTGNGDNFGCPGDPVNPYSQDLDAPEGKIHRLNLDGTAPADNPYVGIGGLDTVWAAGFRNPFRMSFDPDTGSLWVGDVGDLAWEEIDIVVSGGNYGWPHCEGTKPNGCEQPGDDAPIFTYPHGSAFGSCPALPGGSLGTCVIGGSFAGAAFGLSAGSYVFGDCTSSDVYLVQVNGPRNGLSGSPALIASSAGTPSDFVTGPDGAVYYVAIGDGEVRRLALQTGDEELLGKKLVLRERPPDDTRKRLTVVSRDSSIGLGLGNNSADDPVLNGGTLRVVTSAGDTFDNTYNLPLGSANWSYIGTPGDNRGYKYKDRLLANGPIKLAIIKPGRVVKAVGKGSGLGHTLGSNPDPVSLVLTIGGQRYCLAFDGAVSFTANSRYRAINSPAGACPP